MCVCLDLVSIISVSDVFFFVLYCFTRTRSIILTEALPIKPDDAVQDSSLLNAMGQENY